MRRPLGYVAYTRRKNKQSKGMGITFLVLLVGCPLLYIVLLLLTQVNIKAMMPQYW